MEKQETTIQEEFEAYHTLHPEVYARLNKSVDILRQRGFEHYGMSALCEAVRWHFAMEWGENDYKINNNFKSRYVRLMLKDRPELVDFFHVRELRAA